MNDNLTQVDIFGQQYTLRGEGDPQYIKSLTKFVDSKMREVTEGTSTVDSLKVAILAAINIADEFEPACVHFQHGPCTSKRIDLITPHVGSGYTI